MCRPYPRPILLRTKLSSITLCRRINSHELIMEAPWYGNTPGVVLQSQGVGCLHSDKLRVSRYDVACLPRRCQFGKSHEWQGINTHAKLYHNSGSCAACITLSVIVKSTTSPANTYTSSCRPLSASSACMLKSRQPREQALVPRCPIE